MTSSDLDFPTVANGCQCLIFQYHIPLPLYEVNSSQTKLCFWEFQRCQVTPKLWIMSSVETNFLNLLSKEEQKRAEPSGFVIGVDKTVQNALEIVFWCLMSPFSLYIPFDLLVKGKTISSRIWMRPFSIQLNSALNLHITVQVQNRTECFGGNRRRNHRLSSLHLV